MVQALQRTDEGDRVLTGLPPEGVECKPLEKLSLGELQDGKHVPTLTYD